MNPRLLPLPSRHTLLCDEAVSALAWSREMAHLAVGSFAGEIRVAQERDGTFHAQRLTAHTDGVGALLWVENQTLASGSTDGKTLLWNTATESFRPLALASTHTWVERLALSPDGSLLAVAAGPQVSLFNHAGEVMRHFKRLKHTVADLAWHPRGKFLAGVTNGRVVLWRAGRDDVQEELVYASSLLVGRWRPQGDYFAAGCHDNSVHLWMFPSTEDLQMSGYPRKIQELSFHPGGRWLAVGGSPEITVWDFSGDGPAGSTPRQLVHHRGFVTALEFSPDGRWLASTAEDGFLLLWPAEGGDFPLAGYQSDKALTQVAWQADSRRLAVGGEAGQVDILEVPELPRPKA